MITQFGFSYFDLIEWMNKFYYFIIILITFELWHRPCKPFIIIQMLSFDSYSSPDNAINSTIRMNEQIFECIIIIPQHSLKNIFRYNFFSRFALSLVADSLPFSNSECASPIELIIFAWNLAKSITNKCQWLCFHHYSMLQLHVDATEIDFMFKDFTNYGEDNNIRSMAMS